MKRLELLVKYVVELGYTVKTQTKEEISIHRTNCVYPKYQVWFKSKKTKTVTKKNEEYAVDFYPEEVKSFYTYEEAWKEFYRLNMLFNNDLSYNQPDDSDSILEILEYKRRMEQIVREIKGENIYLQEMSFK